MILSQAQNLIAADTHRFRVANCGRRFGKTVLAIEEIKGKAYARGSRIVYIGPTLQQTRDIVWEQLKNELRPITTYVNDSRLEIKVKAINGEESLIVLRGWEAIETLRGQNFDFIVIDEIASVRNWDEKWQEVIRPTLTDRKGQVLFISTPKGFNHFYELFKKESGDNDYKSFHFTSYDNPNIPSEEIDKARLEVTEDRFAQEYLADFRKTEGLVYKEFDRTKHLFKDEDIKFNGVLKMNVVLKMGGLDFGYTNPTALLEIWRDSEDTFWVMSEWYKRGKTNSEVIEYAASLGLNVFYPDPAEPDRIEEMKRAGLNVREVSKDIEKGIDCVRNLFKNNKLRIHKNCYELIQELETYSYKEKRAGSNEPEEPMKENDHACFPAGTKVNGKDIADIGVLTGVKKVFEYQIGGTLVQATADHPVLTQRGLVPIDALRYYDVVWNQPLLFTQVSNGIGIRKVLSGAIGCITSLAKRLMEASARDYTDLFGEKPMGLSLKVLWFIIKTRTPLIIHWTISVLLAILSTLVYMTVRKSENSLKRICKKLLSRLQNGQKHQTGKSGESQWELQTLTSCSQDQSLKKNAICAEKNTRQKGMDETDSAIQTVVKKRYVGRVPVFALKTKSGLFRANGLLVSNCDALRYPLYMQSGQSAIRRAVQSQPSAAHTYGRRSLNQAHQVG